MCCIASRSSKDLAAWAYDGLDELQRIQDLKDTEDAMDAPIICTRLGSYLLFSTKINDMYQPAVLGPVDSIVSDSAH